MDILSDMGKRKKSLSLALALFLSLSLSFSREQTLGLAHMEMYIAEKCPILLQALDKYFKDHNKQGGGKWHMYHSDEGRGRFYKPNGSKTTRRLERRRTSLLLLMSK